MMGPKTGYCCPECDNDENFEVSATTVRMVSITGESDVVDDPGGDIEWEDGSAMRCVSCGHEATAAQFKTEANDGI